MNWKLKAAIQNACAAIPGYQERAYYAIRKAYGDVHTKPDPLEMLKESARLTGLLQDNGIAMEGARVFEVGTGWRVDMPLGFYLAGAASTVTVDLHRYLKPELILKALERVNASRNEVRGYFAPVTGVADLDKRLDALAKITRFEDFMKVTGIDYRAPSDAAATGFPAGSVDIHTSYTVFEHIPGPVLEAILKESSRLLAPQGVALHHIDLSDHFAHSDPAISAINFLQFSGTEWEKYSGNQFAYHNRLRPADFDAIYEAAGHQVLKRIPFIDERSMKTLTNGFHLNPDYRDIPAEDLCTTVLQVLSRPKPA